eukprot:756007-Hanusia_phi.AAC.1
MGDSATMPDAGSPPEEEEVPVIKAALKPPDDGFTLALVGRVIQECRRGGHPVEVAMRHKGLIQWVQDGERLTLQALEVEMPLLFDNQDLATHEHQYITGASRVHLFMKYNRIPAAGMRTLRAIVAAFQREGCTLLSPEAWLSPSEPESLD